MTNKVDNLVGFLSNKEKNKFRVSSSYLIYARGEMFTCFSPRLFNSLNSFRCVVSLRKIEVSSMKRMTQFPGLVGW